jgi:TonB family protein
MSKPRTLAAIAVISLLASGGCAGCGAGGLPGILGVDPDFKPDYTVVETKRQDYAGKPRVTSTVTLPKGLDKTRLEANVRHAILTAHQGALVTPGAIRVRAYQDKVEERPYTAALGIFSPDGKWTTANPALDPAKWHLSLAVRDWYLKGLDPPSLDAKKDDDDDKTLSTTMKGLLTGMPSRDAEDPDAGVVDGSAAGVPADGVAADAQVVQAGDVETAELKVFALDFRGKPTAGTLRIDDKVMGKTPWTGQVEVGKRKISVNWRFTLATIVSGQSNTVTIKLPQAKPKPSKKIVAPVGGRLAKAKIVAGINRDISGLRSCYEKELKKDQFLQGKVVVGFVIDQDGQVTKANIQSSEIDNKRVKRCIVGRVRRLKFPKPEGGSVQVAYPMNFRPKA